MKPKELHQQAMDFSFKAKVALEESNYSASFELYKQAAELESKVAEFYFDKPDLEPTRSIVIRSAAFLNIKAGLIADAKRFIFFGLLNSNDELIKAQLNNALELAVSLGNTPPEVASKDFNYLNLLRQRSVHYIVEPSNIKFGHSTSLEMVKDFSDSYLKSLKAYAISKFRRLLEIKPDINFNLAKEFDNLINPLITSSAYGSFQFSIANDFLSRLGETTEVLELKSNVVKTYHNEIFTNPLNDEDIDLIKKRYSEEEVNEIFRPLTKIKSVNSSYKVGYYDIDSFDKYYIGKIINKQKTRLLTVSELSQKDIGELESLIIHKRTADGRITQKTIFTEKLKSYDFEFKSKIIEPKNRAPIIFNEEILINVNFDSNKGFTFSFDDLSLEYTDIEYDKAYQGFQTEFFNKIVFIINKEEKTQEEERDLIIVNKLINNVEAFKQ